MKKIESKLGLFAQEGGFTLIEMLIVVAIIAILVAIAVPALNTAKADAQEAKRDSISASVATAKIRAVLSDVTGVSIGGAAAFTQFSQFLLVNGSAPSAAILAQGAINGAGSTITGWGTYPAADGTASAIAWGAVSATSVSN